MGWVGGVRALDVCRGCESRYPVCAVEHFQVQWISLNLLVQHNQ